MTSVDSNIHRGLIFHRVDWIPFFFICFICNKIYLFHLYIICWIEKLKERNLTWDYKDRSQRKYTSLYVVVVVYSTPSYIIFVSQNILLNILLVISQSCRLLLHVSRQQRSFRSIRLNPTLERNNFFFFSTKSLILLRVE